ncbi:MAG: hypothetical protein K2M31_04245 [Muribaculaceae bacterium]|nr:hypothetical protein [Muribaculaceae bacterium]
MKSIFNIIFKKKLTEWESVLSKSNSELIESKNEIRRLKEQKLSLKKTIDSNNITLSKFEDKIRQLKNSEDSSKKVIASKNKTINRLNNENLKLSDSESSLKLMVNSQCKTISDNEEKLRLLRSSEDSLKKTTLSQSDKIADLQKELLRLTESGKSYKQTLDSKILIISQKEKDIIKLVESEETLKETINSKIEIIAKQEEEIIQLKKVENILMNILDFKNVLSLKKDEEINQLKETEKSLIGNLDSQTKIIVKSEEENNSIKLDNYNLKLRNKEQEEEINNLQTELGHLYSQLEEAVNSANNLKIGLEDLKIELSKKEDIIKELEAKINQLDENNEDETISVKIDENSVDLISDESEKSAFASSGNFNPANNPDNSEKNRKRSDSESGDSRIDPNKKNRILRYPYHQKPTTTIHELQTKDFPPIENDNIYYHTFRTIDRVFNHRSNTIISANEIFLKKSAEELSKIRVDLEDAVRNGIPYLSCPCCGNLVKISVRKTGFGENRREVQFFTHASKNITCDLKRESYDPLMNFGDFKVYDSMSLRNMRSKLFNALCMETSRDKGVTDVIENDYVKSEEIPLMKRRLADVTVKYNDYDIVFEIVTPLTNIAKFRDRETFYYLNGKQVFWIFGLDSVSDYSELTRAISKDILYAYKRNIFMFDLEAQLESERRKELILKCNWLDENDEWYYQIGKQGKNGILISLEEITFDPDKGHPYYYNADDDFYRINPEKTVHFLPSRDELKKRIKESWDYEQKRDEALNEMQQRGLSVQAIFNGDSWGFKYGDLIFIEPTFDSVLQFYGNYAKVEKDNKYGVVDRFGDIQLQPEYEKVELLTNSRILYATSENWYLYGIIEPLAKYYPDDLIKFTTISKDKSLYSLMIIQATNTGKPKEVFYFIGSDIVKRDHISHKWKLWQSENGVENGELWDEFKITPESDIIIKSAGFIICYDFNGKLIHQTESDNSTFFNKENSYQSSTTQDSKSSKNNKKSRTKNKTQYTAFRIKIVNYSDSLYTFKFQGIPKEEEESFKVGEKYKMKMISSESTINNRLKSLIMRGSKGRKITIPFDSFRYQNLDIFNAILRGKQVWLQKLGSGSDSKWRITMHP